MTPPSPITTCGSCYAFTASIHVLVIAALSPILLPSAPRTEHEIAEKFGYKVVAVAMAVEGVVGIGQLFLQNVQFPGTPAPTHGVP